MAWVDKSVAGEMVCKYQDDTFRVIHRQVFTFTIKGIEDGHWSNTIPIPEKVTNFFKLWNGKNYIGEFTDLDTCTRIVLQYRKRDADRLEAKKNRK